MLSVSDAAAAVPVTTDGYWARDSSHVTGDNGDDDDAFADLDFDAALPPLDDDADDDNDFGSSVGGQRHGDVHDGGDATAAFMASDADLRRMIEALPVTEGLSVEETLTQSFYRAAG